MPRHWMIVITLFLTAIGATVAQAQLNPRWDPLNEPGHQGFGSMIRISPFDPNTIITSGDIFGAAISNDAGVTWQSCIGMAANPVINDFTFISRTTVWAGTLGGPFLSTDGGHNWTAMRGGMPTAMTTTRLTAPIQKVCVDPNNSSNLLAFGGNHRHMNYGGSNGIVWKSVNGGSTWSNITTLGAGAGINDANFVKGSSSVVYAATDAGLYVSSNGGTTWSTSPVAIGTVPSGTACYCITPHPSNANILWVGLAGGYGVYESTNGGSTWVSANNGITDASGFICYSIAVAPSNGNDVYCAFWNHSTYSSTDAGASWTRIVAPGGNSTVSPPSGTPGNLGFQWISVDPSSPGTVVGTGSGNAWKTTNSGISWSSITSAPTSGNYRGNGWSGVNGSKFLWNTATSGLPGQVLTLGYDSAKMMRSNDYLWSWKLADNFTGSDGPYNGSNDASISNDGTIYIATGSFGNVNGQYTKEPIIKGNSTQSGGWGYVAYPSGASAQALAIYTSPSNSNIVWALYGTYSAGVTLQYSTNGGSSWAPITLSSASGTASFKYNIAVNPTAPTTLYIGTEQGVYQSDSTGTTFTLMPNSPKNGAFYNFVYPDPSAPNSLYACEFNAPGSGGVWHYNGSAWTKVWTNGYAYGIAVNPHHPSMIAAVTNYGTANVDIMPSTGVWIGTVSGTTYTWTQCDQNLKISNGPTVAFNPDGSSQLLAGMTGGFFATDVGTSTPHSGGSAPSVLGTISAANFDVGGQYSAYNASSTPSPATVAGVAGQWIKYSVNVPNTGIYSLSLNVKSTAAGGQYHVEFNGVNVTGPMVVGNTSGSWVNITASNVRLVAGTQYLKVYCEAGGAFFDAITTSYSGSLAGSVMAASSGYNLTNLTPLVGNDWAHWGRASVYANFDHKANGFGLIGNVTSFGTGEAHGAFASSTHSTQWSDGTPTATDSGENGYIYSNGAVNTGITFTVPASTVPQTLNVFFGASSVTFNIKVHLSDSSAPDYTSSTLTGSATELGTFTYAAASAGQTMTVTITKLSETGSPGGSVDLVAAWLSNPVKPPARAGLFSPP